MYNQIYSIVNDFIKAVEQDKNFSVLLKNWNGKRGPKRKLSITQVISLNLLRFTIHIKDLKAFHRIVKSMELLPDMPNYENFLKASNKSFPTNCFIYAATRQNMNRLMTCEQWEHLRNRNIIESDWGVLKQNYFLEYHQARCMDGLFRHYVSCISAYILECRLKSYPKIKTRI